MPTYESTLCALVAAPGLGFLALGLAWLLFGPPAEKVISRFTALLSLCSTACAAWLGVGLFVSGAPRLATPETAWFHAGGYHFELGLALDHLSWPLAMITTILCGIVGVFSVRYLHRDRGYFRFFLLLHLFTFGALLVFTATSFDLLLGGWELVGLTSVLLIAFFDERPEPVRNGLRVFGFYRLADLGLLFAIFAVHTVAHTADLRELFPGDWPANRSALDGSAATVIALLFALAAAGKSAQGPFSAWLARAMEGPTPSSAIFYGAISVHLGAYLLLRIEPLLRVSPAAAVTVFVTGAATAFCATLIHRASADAKTSLAYAAMAQLGIVFVEIALGFPRLALAHMCGHAAVRTLQFLRAPSMLHDYHHVHAAAGGELGRTGEHYDRHVPETLKTALYAFALERGYADAILDRFITGPVLRLARWLESCEPGLRPAPPPAPRMRESAWSEQPEEVR